LTAPDNNSCHLAQDLLIPYVAGDVRPETIEWMNRHLDGCSSCRASLAELVQETDVLQCPAPVPSPEPGRRLMGRVRRQVILIIGVVIFSLAFATGGIIWGVSAMRNWQANPENHPVPAEGVTPEQAAQVNLTSIGLTSQDVTAVENGMIARYETQSGQIVTVRFYKHPSPYWAREAFKAWDRSFSTRMMSVRTDSGTVGASRFRSGGHYYQGWHDGRWFINIQIPEKAQNPAGLRDAIKDRLSIAFAAR
jgi:hypothetical protein